MWLCGAVVMMVLAVFPDILFWLQEVLQTNFLTLVTVFGFGIVSLILLHLTVITSKQATEIRRLGQQLALQNQRFDSCLTDPKGDTSKRDETGVKHEEGAADT